MSSYSKTSLDVLRAVHAHPNSSVNEIAAHMKARLGRQYVSALLKAGMLFVTGTDERAMSNGIYRVMSLYSITHRGIMLLRRVAEGDGVVEQKPKVYTELPAVCAPKTAPVRVTPPVECSIATKRVPTTTHEVYVAPQPTGRGYAPRPIRSVTNL